MHYQNPANRKTVNMKNFLLFTRQPPPNHHHKNKPKEKNDNKHLDRNINIHVFEKIEHDKE